MSVDPTTVSAADVFVPFGIVVIGRNEGDRLKLCIASVALTDGHVVYVDSGSTDGSADWARQQGVSVVDLDLSKPFTAARARNEGFKRLLQLAPDVPWVQFVDADCELLPGWLDAAQSFLTAHADVAALCGRLRERHPERSVYNLLCDMEWQAPPGEARSTGGIAVMRSTALSTAGGYREDLVAGEEPELCVRLRQAGWKVWRLSRDMALHDAAMTNFAQWWKRAKRGGHASAEGATLHGAAPERHGVTATLRALAWGALLPLVTLLLALLHPAWLLLLLAYPFQVLRLALRDNIHDPARRWRALFLVLARFPEAQGALQFWLNRLRRKRSALIEYK